MGQDSKEINQYTSAHRFGMFQTPALTQAIRRRRAASRQIHTPASFATSRRLSFAAAASESSTEHEDKLTPWGEHTIPTFSAVFKTTPKFKPPPLGGDYEEAAHWKTKMDLFLRSNRYVRDIIDGRRQHPWLHHEKLRALGESRATGWTFTASTTTSTPLRCCCANLDMETALFPPIGNISPL